MTERNVLKQWFIRGARPLAAQFAEWIDSFWHRNDSIPAGSIGGLQEALDAKAGASALAAVNADLQEHKLDRSPDGINALLDESYRINPRYIPENLANAPAFITDGDGDKVLTDNGEYAVFIRTVDPSSGTTTVYILDGVNGDDTTADGSEEKPFKSLGGWYRYARTINHNKNIVKLRFKEADYSVFDIDFSINMSINASGIYFYAYEYDANASNGLPRYNFNTILPAISIIVPEKMQCAMYGLSIRSDIWAIRLLDSALAIYQVKIILGRNITGTNSLIIVSQNGGLTISKSAVIGADIPSLTIESTGGVARTITSIIGMEKKGYLSISLVGIDADIRIDFDINLTKAFLAGSESSYTRRSSGKLVVTGTGVITGKKYIEAGGSVFSEDADDLPGTVEGDRCYGTVFSNPDNLENAPIFDKTGDGTKVLTDNGEYRSIGDNNTYSINRPDLWPVGVELDFGNGLLGQRFVGTITEVANVNTTTVLIPDMPTTSSVRDAGGCLSYGYSQTTLKQTLGASNVRGLEFWSSVFLLHATPSSLGLRSITGLDRHNAPYDVWVTYTK
jgi:hypothetical protein